MQFLRRTTRARVPSLLLRLLYNKSGQRYTPTHSSKSAKRYRYYVLQAERPQQAISAPVARISALDLESLVLQRLHDWLSDPLGLLDALSNPGDDTALAQTLLAAASARCRAWPTLTSEQLREFVRSVAVKVTIGPGNITIALSKSALRALLLAVADNTLYEPEDDLIELSVEACLQRPGRAIRLVVGRATPGGVQSQDERRLIHTLAQAHQWLEQLLSGEVSSLRRIAAAVGKSERYVSKVIRAAFLAPDLVEAVLERRPPTGLTLAELTDHLPWDWNEQRRRFAVVLGANRTEVRIQLAPPSSRVRTIGISSSTWECAGSVDLYVSPATYAARRRRRRCAHTLA
jgi:site-specific DNA recombinase